MLEGTPEQLGMLDIYLAPPMTVEQALAEINDLGFACLEYLALLLQWIPDPR